MLIKSCPICNEIKYELVYEIRGFMIVKCNDCKHIYTLIDKELNESELYTSGDYEKYDSRKTIFEKIIDYENQRIIDRIEKMVGKGKILDFGCGKGKFLKIAKKNNWETLGLETSRHRAEFGEINYNLNIQKNFYSNGKISGGPFDVISLFHVLEHIPEPQTLLLNLLKDNLNKNGIVVVEVPNIDSFQSRLSGRNWLHLDVPKHIHHFNRLRLEALINKVGFQIVSIEYFSILHGFQGMVNSLLNLFGYRKNIMSELKYRLSPLLFIIILLVLPLAFIFEMLAVLFKQGAIIRIYAKKTY